MKLNYYPETDSLHIDLAEHPGAESGEISEGIVLDYDSKGNLAGIDIRQRQPENGYPSAGAEQTSGFRRDRRWLSYPASR